MNHQLNLRSSSMVIRLTALLVATMTILNHDTLSRTELAKPADVPSQGEFDKVVEAPQGQ